MAPKLWNNYLWAFSTLMVTQLLHELWLKPLWHWDCLPCFKLGCTKIITTFLNSLATNQNSVPFLTVGNFYRKIDFILLERNWILYHAGRATSCAEKALSQKNLGLNSTLSLTSHENSGKLPMLIKPQLKQIERKILLWLHSGLWVEKVMPWYGLEQLGSRTQPQSLESHRFGGTSSSLSQSGLLLFFSSLATDQGSFCNFSSTQHKKLCTHACVYTHNSWNLQNSLFSSACQGTTQQESAAMNA